MKAVTLVVFAVVLVCVTARPDKPDLKQLKADAARKKACMQDCTSVKFDPICAGKDGEKPKSFGSECVMNNYNCEHKDTAAECDDNGARHCGRCRNCRGQGKQSYTSCLNQKIGVT